MAFPVLTGTELLLVTPLRWDGGPSPFQELTTTQAIADLAVAPEGFLAALTAVVALLPTTLPSTPGIIWLDGGVFQVS